MKPFEVLIIESRNALDHYKNIHEGRILQKVLELEDIKSKYFEVLNRDYFIKAIKKADKENVKYIHFSCHGREDGIELADGDTITWHEFNELAWPLLKNKCLAFSSCDVGRGIHEIFDYHKSFCNAIVAPTRLISWSEGLVAFSAFYHKATFPETSTDSDVRVMNHIVGAGTFKIIYSGYKNTTYTIG